MRGGRLGAEGLLELLDILIVSEATFDTEGYERMWRMCRHAKGEEEVRGLGTTYVFVMGEAIVNMEEREAKVIVREGRGGEL